MGDSFMGKIKIKTKQLLLGNTFKIFGVCSLSFILRWSSIILWASGIYLFFKSTYYENILNRLGNPLFYTGFALAVLILLFFELVFCACVKASEQYFLFKKAINEEVEVLKFFSFFSPKRGFPSVFLYTKIFFLKTLWLIYYMVPPTICLGLVFYLYSFGNLPQAGYFVLFSGVLLLFLMSFFMFKVSAERYSAAPFLFTAGNFPPKESIKKSTSLLDGFLLSSLSLKLSFSGWLLSNIFIFPLFYTTPYYSLCKALYVAESVKTNVLKLQAM